MAEISENNKRIAKNTLFMYFRMFILVIVNFYTTRVILQALGFDDFGLYNVVAGFVTLLGFIRQSMTNGIQRFLNFAMGKKSIVLTKEYFSSAIYVQTILAIVVLILSETIGLYVINYVLNIAPDRLFAANVVFQFSILSFLFKILESPFVAVIISHERMGIYAAVSLIEGAMQLIIAFSINIVGEYRVELYSFLLLVLTMTLSLTFFVYSKRISTYEFFPVTFKRNRIKEILSFSGWNLLGAVAGVVKSQGINVLMNIFFGVAVNAARGVAYQVLAGCQKFVSNFQVAMNPQIVKSYSSEERQRYLNLTFLNAKVSFSLMWLLVLPLSFNINSVLELWLGAGNVPEYCDTFVIIILFTGLVDSLGSAMSISIHSTGNIKYQQIVCSLITMSVLPISYVLYRFGFPPETSMHVSLWLSVAAQIARVLIWSRLTSFSAMLYLKNVVVHVVATMLISATLAWGIYKCLDINTTISIPLMIVTSAAVIYIVGLGKRERKSINSFISSKLHKHGK